MAIVIKRGRPRKTTRPVVGLAIAGAGCREYLIRCTSRGFAMPYAQHARKFWRGWFFSIGVVGGSALPWLLGVVSTPIRSLRIGLLVPLAGCLW